MAMELKAELPSHRPELILPANVCSNNGTTEQLQAFNKPDTYHNQHAQLQWLEQQANLPNELRRIVQLLKQHTLAVMQEHMVAHEVELAAVAVL